MALTLAVFDHLVTRSAMQGCLFQFNQIARNYGPLLVRWLAVSNDAPDRASAKKACQPGWLLLDNFER